MTDVPASPAAPVMMKDGMARPTGGDIRGWLMRGEVGMAVGVIGVILLLILPVPKMLLGWMFSSPTGVDRIKAGVPVGWRVAHKTGTGGYGPTNDIGILYPPSGAPIIIAAYYHAASDAPGNEAVIAEATRLALNALGRA